jgi:hypothetical protein
MVGASKDTVLIMRRLTLIASALLALCASYAALAAPMPTLAELEVRIEGSSQMQVLQSDYELARRRLELERRSHGAGLYSQASVSDNDEVVDVGRSRSYRALGAGVGVRVPVLGSRLQWQESVSRYELDLARRDSERELRRRELLRDLRAAYAKYWAAQQLAALSREFLQTEALIESALTRRTKAGLLLDSDRLEFMSGFALVRRDAAAAEGTQQQALNAMSTLVSGPLEGGMSARPPMGPGCAAKESDIASWVDADPEVAFLRQAALSARSSPRSSPLYGVSSDLRLGYQTSSEWPNDQRGGSAAVTWSFEVPIDLLSHRGLGQASAAAERSHAELEYELHRQQTELQLRTLMNQRAVLDQSLRFAQLRNAASNEAVRERELRAVKWAGDVIEQLQQARLARYHSAKALIDAELELAQWSAEWAMIAPANCRPRALYVWSSGPLISELAGNASRPLSNMSAADGVTRVLLSLNASQLSKYRYDAVQLRAALDSAHARGLRVELLLGDPSWLLPEHRDDLLAIIQSLRSLPFDGLHLDIEPDQLESRGTPVGTLLEHLFATVSAVRSISPWHVDVSLHYRHLSEMAGMRTLGDQLSDTDISVTLMIYVANPDRVVEIAQPLLARYPRLTVRVALSLEDSLNREESLYHYSADEQARRIGAIEAALQAPNFGGLTLQPAAQSAAARLTSQ